MTDVPAEPDPRATPPRPADRFVVVNRYRVEPSGRPDFLARAGVALEALAARPGFVTGEVARSTDDPDLLAMLTRWRDVGAYRRALSDHRVKATAVPLMYLCLDEPGAYEVVLEVVRDAALEGQRGAVVAHPSDLAAAPSRQAPADR